MLWTKLVIAPVIALLALFSVQVPMAQGDTTSQNMKVREHAKINNLAALINSREKLAAEVSRDYQRAGFKKREAPAKISQPMPAQATPKPKPKPRVHVTSWVERARLCIRHYESHDNYRALNRSSGASGAYQFLDSTWHAVTGLGGKAMNYSPAVQDAAFYKLFNNGKGARHWVTYRLCA